jgi:uncharacterized protein
MKWLKRTLIIIFILDSRLMRGIKRYFPRSWKLQGQCSQCGQCCRDIRLSINPVLLKAKYPLKIIIAWISWVFDFYLKKIDVERDLLVFGCRHLGQDGKCRNYFFRSHLCRNYPIVEYFEQPVTLPNCGYKVVKTGQK